MGNKYYQMKCPVCDCFITNQLPNINSYYITCEQCGKTFNLYTLIGYNMFLSEKGLVELSDKKPILENNPIENFLKYTENLFSSEFEEEESRPGDYTEATSKIGAICGDQFHFLIHNGFTRSESIEILKQLIDSKIIF